MKKAAGCACLLFLLSLAFHAEATTQGNAAEAVHLGSPIGNAAAPYGVMLEWWKKRGEAEYRSIASSNGKYAAMLARIPIVPKSGDYTQCKKNSPAFAEEGKIILCLETWSVYASGSTTLLTTAGALSGKDSELLVNHLASVARWKAANVAGGEKPVVCNQLAMAPSILSGAMDCAGFLSSNIQTLERSYAELIASTRRERKDGARTDFYSFVLSRPEAGDATESFLAHSATTKFIWEMKLAALLLHESGHIVLKHSGPRSQEQEKEADAFAMEILSGHGINYYNNIIPVFLLGIDHAIFQATLPINETDTIRRISDAVDRSFNRAHSAMLLGFKNYLLDPKEIKAQDAGLFFSILSEGENIISERQLEEISSLINRQPKSTKKFLIYFLICKEYGFDTCESMEGRFHAEFEELDEKIEQAAEYAEENHEMDENEFLMHMISRMTQISSGYARKISPKQDEYANTVSALIDSLEESTPESPLSGILSSILDSL
jgi:hypothetical protein